MHVHLTFPNLLKVEDGRSSEQSSGTPLDGDSYNSEELGEG